MQTQLTTLQTALTTAQNDATTAKAAAATAQTTADKALTLAKAAATQTEVDQIETAIKDIKSLLATKVDQSVYDAKVKDIAAQIDAVNKDLNTLTKGLSDETEARLAAEKDLQAQINTLSEFKKSIDALNLTTAFPKLSDAVTTLQKNLETAQGDIKSNTDNITTLTKRMSDAEEAMKAFAKSTDVTDLQKKLQGEIDNLNVLITKYLSSLVFAPDFYYGGIEATEVQYLPYNAYTLNKYAAPTETGETYATAAKASAIYPTIEADYHMNPSTADWSKITKVGINWNTESYIWPGNTRADATVAQPTFTGADGILKVTIPNSKAVYDAVAQSSDKVTVFTASAYYNVEGKDTTITSDYAAAIKAPMTQVAIADTSSSKLGSGNYCPGKKTQIHLYPTAEIAINNNATHQLIFDDKTGVDITKLVQAHMSYASNTGSDFGIDNLEKYGFRFQYDLTEYIAGANKTKQSIHAHWSADKTHIIANAVNADGTADVNTQSESSIGRMPLLRVTLVDTNNKNAIVAIGYIKFEIVQRAKPADITLALTDGNYNLSCEYAKTFTWNEIEANILTKLGMSKETFESKYYVWSDHYDQALSEYIVNQFVQSQDGKFTLATGNKIIGEVRKTDVDWNGNQTNVLKWTIGTKQLTDSLYDAKTGTYKSDVTLGTWIKFTTYTPNVDQDVYVNLSTGKILVPSVATWADAGKISNYWAAANSKVGTGYAEIHNNVPVIGETGANITNFGRDITKTLEGDSVLLGGVDKFNAFKQKLEVTYTFSSDTIAAVSVSGTPYYVAGFGTSLYATTDVKKKTFTKDAAHLVATLAGTKTLTSGQVVNNNTITYASSDIAKDILNAAPHSDLANTSTAKIEMTVKTSCGMPVPVSNNTFFVKFLRPVNLAGAGNVKIVDSSTGDKKIAIADLGSFTDWRDLWKGISDETADYVSYYKVSAITADVDNATTNMNGSDITKKLLSSYGVSLTVSGTDIVYNNNGQNVNDFTIRIPISCTYAWGTLKSYVDVAVSKTNTAKRN